MFLRVVHSYDVVFGVYDTSIKKIEVSTSLLLHALRMYESASKRNGHPIDRPIIRIYPLKTKKSKVPKKKSEAQEKKKG